ncbi:hypothetical protein IJH15_00720 [Candidatus Saccharibacteria bacterium]|nr:hypothetical protein [Candidatus Saccharibacteria bacterium]MBQ6313419.1 hypothetical protein [Candidatus Saccharibacteria bacterium]
MAWHIKTKISRKLFSVFFILVSLLGIVGMVSVTAFMDGNDIIRKIDEAAKISVVSLMMKKCLGDNPGEMDYNVYSIGETQDAEYLKTTDIEAGPWFQKISGAGVTDGKVSGCSADKVGGGRSVPEIFANYMLGGYDKYMSEIVCGKYANYQYSAQSLDGGWLYNYEGRAFIPWDSTNEAEPADCMSAPDFRITKDSYAMNSVFEHVYNDYKDSADNEYLADWDSIGLSGAVLYRVMYNDFAAGCGPDIGGQAADSLSGKAVSVDYNGGTFGLVAMTEFPTTIQYKTLRYDTIYNPKSQGMYCGEILQDMGNYFEAYADAIIGELRSFCRREIEKGVAEEIEKNADLIIALENKYSGIKNKYDEWWGKWYADTNNKTRFDTYSDVSGALDWINYYQYDDNNKQDLIDYATYRAYKTKWGNISDRDDDSFMKETDKGGYICNPDMGVEFDVTITEPSDPGETDYEQDACYGASGSLSWIVCPVMQKLGGALDWVYDEMVEPFLKVNKGLLSGSEGTREAWGVVVGFANLAVVIFILIIIFSQLTGVGIDNYGIKKSLPKVVIAAVLINFSFVICQVAVDISNIVGNGLNSTLSDISVGNSYECTPSGGGSGLTLSGDNGSEECVPMSSGSSEQAGMFKTMFNVAAGGLIGVGVASVVSSVLSTGFLAGFLIPILLLLVTAVIAVLFFFVLLGMRQAGVVILVVLSPLALACYMLPNMKKYYDKWFKVFSGLLLVYPICGLLIGGGQLTSKIILSASTNYMTYFVGCVLMVTPFFLIPSLLKGSFAAMGNIGAKVSGLGKSFGSKGRSSLDRGIKNSNRYQQRVKENQERQALRRANRIKNGVFGVGGLGNRAHLNRRQQRRLMAAGQVIAADQSKTRKAYEEQFAELNGSDLATEVDNAGRWIDGPDGDQKMAALITALNKAGKEEKVFELLDAHSGKAAMKSTAVRSALIGSGNFLQTAYGKRKEEKTFSEFKNAASKGLADYIKDNGVKDMDKDSLKYINESGLGGIVSSEMVKNGAISASSPKVREQFNKMLEGQINNISDLSNLKLTANDLSTMDDTTAGVILNKVKKLPGIADENAAKLAIQNALQTQIASARSNEQAMSKISPDGAVHDVFFSGAPTPTPPPPAPGPTPPTPPTPTAYGGGGGYGTDTSAWD